ncbi:hypothetical protein QAD02_014146 [Eretmocerus hayati]|uniref:Uncharacterized protein n=1 Tax=Eretmocerus hayati TaxID=131215 RepID=A0ACC2P4V9_9HYME|nr:hypothetical protein QAD02_014146 [Eretmocerus hayati]
MSGTSWIYNLNKPQLLVVCKENEVEHQSSDTVDDLRKKLRELVRGAEESGQEKLVITWEDVKNKYITNRKQAEQYLIANGVTDSKEKRAIMLSKVIAETYDVIAKVCETKKPGEKEYDAIVKAMSDYIKLPAPYLVYRNDFRSRMQQDNESISEYVAALQTLAMDRKFPENHADDQILGQLIIGLCSENIKAELLKIIDSKLDTALQKAFGSEAAEKSARKLEHGRTHQQELHHIGGPAPMHAQGCGRGRGRARDRSNSVGRGKPNGWQTNTAGRGHFQNSRGRVMAQRGSARHQG